MTVTAVQLILQYFEYCRNDLSIYYILYNNILSTIDMLVNVVQLTFQYVEYCRNTCQCSTTDITVFYVLQKMTAYKIKYIYIFYSAFCPYNNPDVFSLL